MNSQVATLTTKEVFDNGVVAIDALADIFNTHDEHLTDAQRATAVSSLHACVHMTVLIQELVHLMSHVNKPALDEAKRDHLACLQSSEHVH